MPFSPSSLRSHFLHFLFNPHSNPYFVFSQIIFIFSLYVAFPFFPPIPFFPPSLFSNFPSFSPIPFSCPFLQFLFPVLFFNSFFLSFSPIPFSGPFLHPFSSPSLQFLPIPIPIFFSNPYSIPFFGLFLQSLLPVLISNSFFCPSPQSPPIPIGETVTMNDQLPSLHIRKTFF